MRKKDISKRDLTLFSLGDIRKFLLIDRWSITDKRRNTHIYEKKIENRSEPLRLFLPAKDDNVDYFERILDFIHLISSIKNTSVINVINTIRRSGNDILKMRIINPGDFRYSLPLDIASKEIDALKRLFMYGASSEEKPRPFFDKATTIGKNHANQCQFGHTFEGSFGFTINSPILESDAQIDLYNNKIELPFERKVVERIITGFKHISQATEKKDPSIIVNNFESGLNSKMCEAIVDLSIEKSKKIEFSIDWSLQFEPTLQVRDFRKLILEPSSIEITEEASSQLKKVEPFKDIIIGKIVTLHSNKSPFIEEDFARIAIIKHTFEEKIIEVKLELSKEEYQVAYAAHGKGCEVKVSGNIFRKGNTWRMIDIVSIQEFN